MIKKLIRVVTAVVGMLVIMYMTISVFITVLSYDFKGALTCFAILVVTVILMRWIFVLTRKKENKTEEK